MEALTDQELLAAYSRGNERAFATLMERHAVPVKGYAIRMLRNVERAEEVCSGTFLRVALARGQWEERGASFRSYLFTIANRLCIDIIRKDKVARNAADGVLQLARAQQVTPSPEARAILGQQASLLERAVGELKEDQRQVIVLRCIMGFSSKEVAGVIGCSASQVDSTLSYAKKQLRQALTELANEFGDKERGGNHGG